MAVLSDLEPKEVFRFFEEICQIPHPSYKEKKISDYLVKFAKDRGLEVYQDELCNVIMIKEATPGYENEEPIILQGHMDMVCEKDPDCTKDMDVEGLDLEVNGDFISAKGTTLGGDDGIAVAYALALLDSDTLQHPRLEFVCTVGEEVGMEGAQGIDTSPLKGHLLLNMDSEEEGVVLAGCAGGGTACVTVPLERETSDLTKDMKRMTLHIHGLAGGHSGTEIHKGHPSSVQLLARLLHAVSEKTELRLISMGNGTKDNAISRDGKAVVAVADAEIVREIVSAEAADMLGEFKAVDPGLQITVEEVQALQGVDVNANPLSRESTEQVIALIYALPTGVQRMSDHVPGLVETSLNWGVADAREKELVMRASVRSSVGTAYREVIRRIGCVADYFGATLQTSGEYPAWEWVEKSMLRDRMSRIYQNMFGKELVIEAIHAGVECGLLAGKIENLDAISMGPDILDIHTPQERLSISSVERMYRFIKAIIASKN